MSVTCSTAILAYVAIHESDALYFYRDGGSNLQLGGGEDLIIHYVISCVSEKVVAIKVLVPPPPPPPAVALL